MPTPFALTAYGLPHVLGLLPTRDGAPNPNPLPMLGLLTIAEEGDLVGVDMPLPKELSGEQLRELLAERSLRLVVEAGCVLDIPLPELRALLEKAQAAGAKVVRFTLSGILCGDRRKLGPGGWVQRRDALAVRLREVLPLAEGLGLSLALENHQDATTDDLLWLYDASGQSRAYGICLDTGNPLAVGEEPVGAARALAPLLRHLHLKDYTIHFAPEGYRLVRCAAGTGVIDFPTILEIARANGFSELLPGIEIAAQPTRTIPLLEPSWWAEYPPRPAAALAEALTVLWKHGRPQDEPYSSAWERGEDSAAIVEEEYRLVRESMAYFRALEG